ncbi:hypothetical protein N7488_001378 [Penicillium malachiteum]|nr:hypothetical protein N7488_001378 [Penicillium malachiteum]
MPTKAFILVFAGDPLDYTKYRHTGLSTSLLHIEGSPGIFQFYLRDNYRPDQSRRLVRQIRVAELPDSISEATIRGVVSRTLVKNGPQDIDWNCQNWVGDALTRMVNYGYLNVSQRASAIYEMTDACLEAEDE